MCRFGGPIDIAELSDPPEIAKTTNAALDSEHCRQACDRVSISPNGTSHLGQPNCTGSAGHDSEDQKMGRSDDSLEGSSRSDSGDGTENQSQKKIDWSIY